MLEKQINTLPKFSKNFKKFKKANVIKAAETRMSIGRVFGYSKLGFFTSDDLSFQRSCNAMYQNLEVRTTKYEKDTRGLVPSSY